MTMARHRIALPPAPAPAPGDLRMPLIAVVVLAVGIASLAHLPVALAALAAAAVLAVLCRASLRDALHRAAHVEGFLVILLLFLPFTTPGDPLFHLGPLAASQEGLARAGLIAIKVNAVALVMLALLGRVRVERLGAALMSLGAPVRLASMLDLILRHSHTARDGLRRQHDAMRARGFAPRSNLHTWRSYGHLFGGALLRAFHRAERVEEAIRMRGGQPVALPLPQMPARDRLACLAALAAALALVAADRLST